MSSIDPDVLEHLRASVWPALESSLGLPRGILEAVAWYETRGAFDDKTSRAGARGIFQLTPIALSQIRLDASIAVDPSNPYQASYGAAYLLARYFRLFQGLPPLAIAAYNAGEGTVRKFVRDVATQGKGFLSYETRDYIRGVLPLIRG
jgi:soluble lytic murein transglycosylase-like protein